MIQYLLTAIAGMALGIVALRIWQARETQPGTSASPAEKVEAVEGATMPAAIVPRHLLIGAGTLAAAAIAVIAWRSSTGSDNNAASTPIASASAASALDDVDTMINRLADRLAKNPNDGEGFRMLGWSYVMTSRPDRAIEPYKRALALLPQSALVHSGYGEALTGMAKGTVSPEAKAEFDRAVALDPKEPRSLYFLALWQAQHGEERQALEKWIALANSGPADSNWQPDLRRQIATTSAKLGIDVSSRLKGEAAPVSGPAANPAAAQAISAMPPAQQQASINQMVDGLAAKLKTDPTNVERWAMLLRSRMVLKQSDQAGSDLAIARKALANDAAGRQRLDALAKELGIPGA